MITVGMNYQVIKGREQEFEAVFGKVLDIMGRTDGHVQTRLYRDAIAPESYLIHSEWSSQSSFEAFTGSAQFKNVTDWGKASILASRPKHQIYGAQPQPPVGCPARA